MSEVVGIDACPRGWVAVVSNADTQQVATSRELAPLVSRFPEATVIAIDMPIGLPTSVRECDLAAREFVGPRRNSVFMTPPADVLYAPTYAEANRTSREKYGNGISRQAFALAVNVRVVNELAEQDPRLIEVHPEVSFRELVGEELASSKATWNGQAVRRHSLARAGINLPELLEEAGGVPPPDILDAAVAAWTAGRYEAGEAKSLPPDAAPASRPTIWF